MGLKSLLRRKKKSKGGSGVSEADAYAVQPAVAEVKKAAAPVNGVDSKAPVVRAEPAHEDADVRTEAPVSPQVASPVEPAADNDLAAAVSDEVPVAEEPQPPAPAAPERDAPSTEPETQAPDECVVAQEAETGTAAPIETKAAPATPAPAHTVEALHVLYGVCAVYLAFVLAVLAFFGPGILETIVFAMLSLPLGLGYGWMFQENKRKKGAISEILRTTPGLKGLVAMLGQQPAWLQYTESEKVDFLNKFMAQAWPFYDKAVCATVKELVEPIMDDFKPVGFNRIGFKSLTFGDAPMRIEGVRLDRIEGDDPSIVMDIDIRWCGDASIVLAIEVTGENTRMAPKITDLQMVGTVRVILKPLLDVIPCFGAVVVTVQRPPNIKFNLDFGKALGGSMVGSPVKALINGFLRDIWGDMLVWPKRLVVPIMEECFTGPLDHLQLHSVGLLLVTVVKGEGLPRADTFGTSDPQVELYTELHRKVSTTVKKNTLNPVWGEGFYMLVQEPLSQNLMVVVNDIDVVNVNLKLNMLKAAKEAIGAKELLGRAVVPLCYAASHEGQEVEGTYDLGRNEFSDTHGPGVGCGTITLKMVYRSFESLRSERSTSGAVIVTVLQCRDLVAMDSGGVSDPYVKVKIGKKEFKTVVVPDSLDPVYNETFEFFDSRAGHCVTTSDVLKVKVYDRDTLSDDFMGKQDLPVTDVIESCRSTGACRKWYKLEGAKHGEIELKIEFIPFT